MPGTVKPDGSLTGSPRSPELPRAALRPHSGERGCIRRTGWSGPGPGRATASAARRGAARGSGTSKELPRSLAEPSPLPRASARAALLRCWAPGCAGNSCQPALSGAGWRRGSPRALLPGDKGRTERARGLPHPLCYVPTRSPASSAPTAPLDPRLQPSAARGSQGRPAEPAKGPGEDGHRGPPPPPDSTLKTGKLLVGPCPGPAAMKSRSQQCRDGVLCHGGVQERGTGAAGGVEGTGLG